METEEDPLIELNMLVEALSEMAKPHGYIVKAHLSLGSLPALDIKRLDGKWVATMCITHPPDDCSFSFLDKKSAAAALVSKYKSNSTWEAQFFSSWEVLRFPGGSPAELSLKAAAGVKAVLYMG